MNKHTRNTLIGLGIVAIIGLVIYFSTSGKSAPRTSGKSAPPSLSKGNACRKQCNFKEGMAGSVLSDYIQCYKECVGN